MKRTLLSIALLIAATSASASPWTYRGTLNDGGKPADGSYDLRVTLLNEAKSASLSAPITLFGVKVVNGSFAANVDFGIDLNNAPAMALKTEVAPAGSGGFVALGEAARFDPKAALAGICWDTEGNAGTNPATNFIGTTDNQPLVVRAFNIPVLRIFPTLESPNLVAGAAANTAEPSTFGQVIAGGGRASNTCGPLGTASCLNRTTNSYSVVSGGQGNNSLHFNSTVGGGWSNTASGFISTVGGGNFNTASGDFSAVSGGQFNCAGGDYSWAGGRGAKIRPGNGVSDGNCATNSLDADGDNGTFVWADDQAVDFTSTGARQFLVRAQGGMAINTNTPTTGAALTVNGGISLNGGIVAGGIVSVGSNLAVTGTTALNSALDSGNINVRSANSLSFGSQTRQMLNLWGPNVYGIGVQGNRMYFRAASGTGGFSWFEGGVHSDATDDAGVGGNLRMRLSSAGQLQTSTGTISTLSDARLKDQVHDYTRALDQINALRPVRYRYRDAGKAAFQAEGMHLGFVAQEVQQVFPEWVSEGDDGYLMLSMRGFEAVAVRAIQELSVENTALKAQLTHQNAEFQSRLNALEAAQQR